MRSMKLVVFSDIYNWLGYKKLVDRIKPDLIVLAGDLVSCGTATFHTSKTPEIDRRTHIKKFYQFLRYSSKKSKVFVVKGNHDYDFEGD